MKKNSISIRSLLMLQLTVSILTFFFVFMIIESLWFYNRYQREIDNNIEVARAIGLSFDGLVRDINREETALGHALLTLVPYNRISVTELLKSVNALYYSVSDFSVLDSTGDIYSSSRPEITVSSQKYLKYLTKLKSGDTAFISDLIPNDSSHPTGFIIGRGFKGVHGNLLFAIVAFVEAEKLGEITLNIPQQPDNYFTLFDSRGVLVYTNQIIDSLTFSRRQWKNYDKALRTALQGKIGYGFFHVPVVGKGSRRIGARVPIGRLDWVSGSAMDLFAFFRPIVISLLLIIIITVIVAVIFFVWSKRTILTIVESLKIVQNHLVNVAQGNFFPIQTESEFTEFNSLIDNTNRMAEELKYREEKLNLLAFVIENSNDFIILATPDMVPFYLNKAGHQMVGINNKKEINTMKLIDFIYPEDQTIIEQVAFEHLRKDDRWFGEIRLQNFQTGHTIPTIWNVFAVKNNENDLLGWATISPDLSQLKKATKALQQSEEKFRGAVEGLLDAFVIMSPLYDHNNVLINLQLEYANKVALDMTGIKSDQYTGYLIADIFPVETQQNILGIFGEVLKTSKPAIIDNYRINPSEGKKEYDIYIDIRASKLENNIALAWHNVTDRVIGELILRQSEENFRSLSENSPEIIARFDRNLRHTYINSYGEKVYGIPKEQIIGKTDADLHLPVKKVELWKKNLNEIFKSGEQKTIDFDFDSPILGHQYFSSLFVPEFDTLNNITSILTITRDISELKNTEQKLRESEAFGRKILDSSLNGLYIYDIEEMSYSFINSQYTQITGYTIEELNQYKGEAFLELFHPDDRTYPATHLQKLRNLKDNQTIESEYRFKHKDGYWIWCLAREAVFSRNIIINKVKQFIGTFLNITDRKIAEDELKQSEHRFRELANSMPQLVWTANPDGSIDYYNKSYKNFDTILQAENNKWHWKQFLSDEDKNATLEAWNRSLSTGDIYQMEHRLRHEDGTYHWYLSRAVPVFDQKGTIIKWYGTTTNIDISKLTQIALADSENHLKQLNENLESLVIKKTEQVRSLSKALILAEQRERKRFSQILHEDLQQVLFSARMEIELIKLDADQIHNNDISNGISDSMQLLTKAIKLTKNMAMELNPPILYSQGLDTALSWLGSFMKQTANLTVNLTFDSSISSIKDETQIMVVQMVRELLSNVAKHSGVLLASVNASLNKFKLTIIISDNGKGFDVEEIRNKSTKENKLGLFAIEERLRFFGGELLIQSSPGKGTTCVMILPVENSSKSIDCQLHDK